MKSRPVGIFYEHPVWLTPLFAELEKRRIPFVRIHAGKHTYNPAEREVPYSLLINRVSSTAQLRGNAQGIFQSSLYLAHVERLGIPVLNGTQAQELEASKAKQLELLATLGMPFPKTRIVNHVSQIVPAARGLRFPVVVSVNLSAHSASIRKFKTVEHLKTAIDLKQVTIGIDHSAIVQEFIPAIDNQIVRVETLNGKFLYGLKVHTKSESFNLRPAELGDGEHASSSVLRPAPDIRVESYVPPQDIIRDVERIAREARLDTGAVEYVVDARTGLVNYCSIIAFSNFVNDPVNLIGFDPTVALVDHIEDRLWPAYEHEPVLAI